MVNGLLFVCLLLFARVCFFVFFPCEFSFLKLQASLTEARKTTVKENSFKSMNGLIVNDHILLPVVPVMKTHFTI